ncbi:ATP-binding cassette domain-containing protein [Rhizobium sp. P38BS-XIX]|uniref:ATP-binding cassette domain-containing protein n=1 Tax=Rhizobium sp. P38BS-XIX TaxID=2726740 RepID=UPI001457190B|nr:ATP-binding cassette domain-containing protein [Rhizobium sp. P38BS-XIX]NLS01637.1 ATP-binding cassette domain-containing protein [Rhizobium sp. P38BS-XIX]
MSELAAGAASANSPSAGAVVASLENVTKVFGGTVAVSNVTLELRAGEVLALLGENGAGKSTCVKLLAGVYRPDGGHVAIGGQSVRLSSPLEAQHAGIAVMHQHPGLFPDLSIAENLFIGQTGTRWKLDHLAMQAEARRLLKTVGLDADVSLPLGRLRTSEQQLVEVARALSLNARVLIMDEPTAALSQREVERLFSVVDELRKHGVAMMFVGHRMDEIYRIADRITVLRDGRFVGTELTRDLSRERAIQMMVGRALDGLYPRHHAVPGEVVLKVEGLSRDGAFEDVSFELRGGEILGFGGLVGSGRTEIARVLFGIDQADAGKVVIDGRDVAFSSPREAMKGGVAYVSEDRLGQSLVMDFSILNNASLTVLDEATQGGLMSQSKELALAEPFLDRLRLRFSSYDQPVSSLSGGNQQKVVLSKWLATNPRVLILDEPTQGIDVQSKAGVHEMMADLASQGMAIILISSELPELLGMSDRIIVLREGKISGRFGQGEATQEKIIEAATDAIVARADAEIVVKASDTAGDVSVHEASRSVWSRLFARREFGLVAAILAVIIPISFLNIRMLSGANLAALAMDAGLLMIVAVAQMLVLITRSIDLSVAAVIGLAAYGAASTLHLHPEIGVAGAVLLACGIGLVAGLANGLIITYGRVPAIVVTLGTMSVFRGLNSLWAGGTQVSADQVPQSWLDMTSANILGVPAILLIAVLTLAIVGYILRYTSLGRELYAIGSNPDGARLIGIPSRPRILLAFAAAGLLAGFDGALWASRYATVDARVAYGFELTVIAAVVVGGVAVRGGSGTVLGVAAGALLLLVINNGLTLVRVDPLWLQGVYGLVILVAIAIDAYVARRATRGGTH